MRPEKIKELMCQIISITVKAKDAENEKCLTDSTAFYEEKLQQESGFIDL